MTTATQKPSFLKRAGLWLVLLITVLVFGAVVGLNMISAKKKAEAAANMPEPSSLVTVMPVTSREWTPVIETVGTVRPNQGAMLSSEAAGKVSRIHVKAGDQVKKGQLLLELDSAVETATLKASEAQLPAIQANYNRFRSLVASNSASKAELDSAQAAYNQLLATIESLKSQINRRKIYAPFSGVAGIVRVNEGEYIGNGTQIVRIEDNSSMKVRFTLAQTDIERVYVGQKVTVTADALTGETFEAAISAIDPAVNTSTGLIDFEATVDGRGKLMSGMFTRLRIALPTQLNQIVVPQIAITYAMYGETAYILQPLSEEDKSKLEAQGKDVSKMFRAKQLEVKTLDRQGIYAQLQSGVVNVGDTLVTGGFQRLRNNALVQVVDKQGAGTAQPAKNSRL